ncbi:MAG: DNA translocase FtsK [bacterium]|nr:DNA translocase FtsK [bacterium]
MSRRNPPERPRRLIWPIFLCVVCLFVWASLLTFSVGDWPSPHQYPNNDPADNACGRVGGLVAYGTFYLIGDGAYPLILFASMAAVLWLVNGRIPHFLQRAFGLVLLCSATAVSVHLVSAGGANTLPEGDGGVLGAGVGDLLQSHFSGLGTVLILVYGFFVGLVLTAEGWVLRFPGMVKRAAWASGDALVRARDVAAGAVAQASTSAAALTAERSTSGGSEPVRDIKINAAGKRAERSGVSEQGTLFEDAPPAAIEEEKDTKDAAVEDANPTPKPGAKGTERRRTKSRPAEEDADGEDRDPVVKIPRRRDPPPLTEAYPRAIGEWLFPPVNLLGEPEYSFSAQQESAVRGKARVLEQTLSEFRLDARVVEIDTGPVITMYELSLAPGIKVSQISSLSNDIARALRAPAIRVVAPIPGKNTVGVEVPNVEKEVVRLRELLTMGGRQAQKMGLPLLLGKDAGGDALIADLTRMPHLLIAGTTGSGKSVCLNSIIASILMTQRPDRCKMILVDPKMVEMSQFKGIPHLMSPIVTDLNRAQAILEWAVTKMDERYELLAEAGVRNIKAYNQLTPEDIEERFKPTSDAERARIPKHIPYVVIVIDELADLMMTSPKEVEHFLSRLAQKSRAIGIHIVVATQRPEAKVVTGLIKSNMPCRIAFRVASRMDSRIVLDQNGAEVLMGQGDMLFLPPGSAKLLRAQGTFLDDDELHAIIDFLAERSEPEFHPQLIQLPGAGAGSAREKDELFDDAVELIIESGRGSVSLLQRRLAVGYSRASRLIEMMADAGIIGAYKGSVAREVLLTADEWDAIKQRTATELQEGYAADDEEEEEEEGDEDDYAEGAYEEEGEEEEDDEEESEE